MTGNEIRRSFLDFFRDRGHEVVPSSSLVPHDDPTLLFTNAGMVPFKGIFLGTEKRAVPRAASSQKCLRLSGKHNDLEEVGLDTYHHTLFEMLGNWSFGDYYKKEAIDWAWELLTAVWKLPKEKLWVTVYRTDDEAEALWREVPGVDPNQILRFDEKDNFWEMGATGPCGPCSEIHIDRGAAACDRVGHPGHVCRVNAGCARFIELWNLVFIQYDRAADGSLTDLPAKHVDTGMGLERVTAVLQNVFSNYDADLLRDVIRFTEEISGKRYGEDATRDVSFRVIADHARAVSFLVADRVVPSNEGRGYVLRRVLRRAARHGKNLGLVEPFLHRVAGTVAAVMEDAYPELRADQSRIEDTIREEEERFAATLERATGILAEEVGRLAAAGVSVLPGDAAFRLYDTYGLPLDLTEDLLKADGISVDREGFTRHMEEQRHRAREAQKAQASAAGAGLQLMTGRPIETSFAGDFVEDVRSEVLAVFVDGVDSGEVPEGASAAVVVAETPFYAEGGGQVGDQGTLEAEDGSRFRVEDTRRMTIEANGVSRDAIVHMGRVEQGRFRPGERVRLRIDAVRRRATRGNHSVTHILHGVLRETLGAQVHQAGSLVTPDRTRFDFTHQGPVSPELLARMEDEVNLRVRQNADVTSEVLPYAQAIERGALAFFGDKYGDSVRVVQMGDFSIELCGGTHVRRTGDIGTFKIRAENGVAAGVRRIEALTGEGALGWIRERETTLAGIGEALRGPESEALEKLQKLLERQKDLERELARLESKLRGSTAGDLVSLAREVAGVRVLAAAVDGADPKGLREMADQLREKLGSGIIVLGCASDGKAVLLASVTKDLVGRFSAGDIIREIAPLVGGRGGGRPDLAQAGGSDPSKLPEALERVYEVVA